MHAKHLIKSSLPKLINYKTNKKCALTCFYQSFQSKKKINELSSYIHPCSLSIYIKNMHGWLVEKTQG